MKRKRRRKIPNIKPPLLPIDDLVTQLIGDILWFLPLTKLNPAPPTTFILESLGWGFRWKKYWNKSKWGAIPKKASQRWTKIEMWRMELRVK